LAPDPTPKRYNCQHCNRQFNCRQSKSRHLTTCKENIRTSSHPPSQVTDGALCFSDSGTKVLPFADTSNDVPNEELPSNATSPNLTQEIDNEVINSQSVQAHGDMFDQVSMFKTLCIHLQEQMSHLQKQLNDVKSESFSQSTQQPQHPHKIGYIYLIKEREFVNSNQNVFKVGRTIQKTPTCYLERLKDYKRGSQVLSVLHVDCDDCEHIESKVKDTFNKMFKRHNDGHEYFEGDPKTMSMAINAIYADYYSTQKRTT
jgi:hypothetical protein